MAPRRLLECQACKTQGGGGMKSFNDTDAILNEAVLQFTLNKTLITSVLSEGR